MTQPKLPAITPSETVHIPPPEKPAVRRLSQPQAEAILGGAANLILAKVALALGGIDVLGVKPFAFLTKWGQDIQAKARAAFDVATSSQAVANSSEASTAIAIGQSATTQTNVQTTWDTLWEANTGLTATTPKTVTDVKTTQANVRTNATNGATGAVTNAGNIQSTWNNIYDGTFYQGVTGSNRSLSDVYNATYYSAYTANGADEQSDTNSGNIQLTWNEIYFAAGGTGPTGTSKSLQDAKDALSGVTDNAATGAEYSQETIDAIYNTTYGTNTSGKSPSDIIPALEETVAEKDEQFAAGSNGMLSPDFENTIIARHKIGTSGEYSTEQKRSGARSWKWVQAAGQDSGLYFAPTRLGRRFTVRPAATADTGDWWYVEAWLYRATASTGTVRFGARWYNTLAGNQVPDYTETALSSITQNTWTKFSSYIQVPEGRDAGEFYIQTNAGTTTSAVFYLDDVVVREVTDAKEAADAALAASQYVDDTQQAGSNLVLSPGFEKLTVPRLYVGTPGASTGYSTVQKRSGAYAFRYQQAAAAATGLYLAPTATSAVITVNPGDRFDVEAAVLSAHSTSPTGAIRVGVEWLLNGSALSPAQEKYREWTLAVTSTDTALGRNTWKTLTYVTPACPAGANGARFFVYSTSATATGNLTYVDDVVVREVTLQQDTNDAVGQGLGGTSTPPGGGTSPSDLGSLAGDLNRNVGDLGAAVSEIAKDTAGSALSGKAFSVNFGTLLDSSNFPATFTATRFTTSGTHGGAQVSGGRLTYVPSSTNAMDNGRSLGLYVTDHDLQYQRVGVTLTSVLPYLVSNSRGGNWIFARASTDASVNGLPDSCVYARLYYPNILAGLSNSAQLVLGYTSGGSSGTPVLTKNFTYTVGSTYWLEAGDPVTQNTNTYRVLKDNLDLTGWVSLGFPSLTGTRSGLGLEVSSDGVFRYDPARVASWVAYDNAPAATLGEGLRAEGGTGLPVSTSATVANFASGLFGNARSTAGLTWSTINNAATASVAGWYAVTASVYTATTTSATFQLVLAVNETGSLDNGFVNHTWGDPVSGTGAKAATVHGLVYLDKGGSVKVRYLLASASITTAGGADAVRTSFNMAFANNTLPTNP